MAKISKNVVDADLRARVFEGLLSEDSDYFDKGVNKINDCQYGVLLTDLNGVERYVRIGAIVAEERTDKTARELMESEIKAYQDAQAKKARNAQERAKKAEADKARREAKAKEKKEKEEAE